MQTSQQVNKEGFFSRSSFRKRICAAIIFLSICGLFGLLRLAGAGKIDIGRWFGPCGFKQRHGLPCPTCGMTGSAIVFVQGKIFESFYIHPAGGLLYCGLVVGAFWALFPVIFGRNFRFLGRFFAEIKVRWIVLAVIAIILVGWAVTLARALRMIND